jgi:hypothetical protein
MKPHADTILQIDTSNIQVRTGTTSYTGLPDTHDYSKHKAFFALYIHRYCSGHKENDGKYIVDFCSDPGRELFDQYRVWKVWGVDLGSPNKDGKGENVVQKSIGVSDIRTMPRVMFGWFLATAALSGLSLVTGLFALCTTWAKIASLFLASIATLAALVTAILAQIFFPTLVHRTDGYRVVAPNNAGGGVLTSKLGIKPLAGLWTLAVLSLLSTLLLAGALHSDRKSRAAKASSSAARSSDKDARMKEYQLSPTASGSKAPSTSQRAVPRSQGYPVVPGIIRRATGKLFGAAGMSRYDDTSYETLRVVGADGRGRSRSRSREPAAGEREREKSAGRDSVETVVPGESGRGDGARYEPYRHQETA